MDTVEEAGVPHLEWQVGIYVDLCSQSEPPDKSIISYYRELESKRLTSRFYFIPRMNTK